MTIGAGKSDGRLATTRDSASIPPAEDPITTSCGSVAACFPTASPPARAPRGILGYPHLMPVRSVRLTIAGEFPSSFANRRRAYRRTRRAGVRISSSPDSARRLLGPLQPVRQIRLRPPMNGMGPRRPFVPCPEAASAASGHPPRSGVVSRAGWPCHVAGRVRDFILTDRSADSAFCAGRSGESTQCPFPSGKQWSSLDMQAPRRGSKPDGEGLPYARRRALPRLGDPRA